MSKKRLYPYRIATTVVLFGSQMLLTEAKLIVRRSRLLPGSPGMV